MSRTEVKQITRLVNHGPLVVVSATYNERTTYTPVAWNMPVSDEPALIAITIGQENFINEIIRNAKSFCLNILPIDKSELILELGNCSGRDTDKAKKFGLKVKKCLNIDTYFMKDSLAHIELNLYKDVRIEDLVNIFIGKPEYAEAEEGTFNEIWDLDKVKTTHHLGNNNFCTITKKW